MKKCLLWVLMLCLLAPAALAETVTFSGTVVPNGTVEVYIHSSARVDALHAQVGNLVAAGDALATLHTNAVYAPMDGVVAAVYGETGDDAAAVTARWGAVLALDEHVTFTVSADNAKAYASLETKNVTLGETVHLQSRSDENRTGTGIIIAIDNSAYTVKGTSGALIPGESVDVFRSADFHEESCLGRGTVARINPTAVSGEGTIVSVAVTAGQSVKKGDLLFVTLPGDQANEVLVSPVSGVIAQVNLSQGAAAAEDSVAFVLYAEDAMVIEAPIPEADLSYISVGETVSIAFLWNEDSAAPITGMVESISSVADENGDYTATILFTPDASVRYGMTVTITPGASAWNDKGGRP